MDITLAGSGTGGHSYIPNNAVSPVVVSAVPLRHPAFGSGKQHPLAPNAWHPAPPPQPLLRVPFL